jgi:hypothetical protein
VTGKGMTTAVAAQLREPFKDIEIGKLPRITCGGCRNSQAKVCDRHKKIRCDGCRNWITEDHMHLDFVGHAEVTDRLLQVDPEWTWEPMAFGPDGLPHLDTNGGLWMWLTVAGVRKPGYGHADGKKGGDAVKETIGDGLRNSSMRFGVALDLWGAKFDPPTAVTGEDAEGSGGAISGDQREVLADLWGQLGYSGDEQRETRLGLSARLLGMPGLVLFSALSFEQADKLVGLLRERLEKVIAGREAAADNQKAGDA